MRLTSGSPARLTYYICKDVRSMRNLLMEMPEYKLTDAIAALPPSVRRPLFTTPALGMQRKLLVSAAPQKINDIDLSEDNLLRGVYSNWQLDDLLVNFTYNHISDFIA